MKSITGLTELIQNTLLRSYIDAYNLALGHYSELMGGRMYSMGEQGLKHTGIRITDLAEAAGMVANRAQGLMTFYENLDDAPSASMWEYVRNGYLGKKHAHDKYVGEYPERI